MSPPPGGGASGEAPAVPAVAEAVFGARLGLAEEYARWLTVDGVRRGLVGPHESPRIWERHLLNCAVVAELVPAGASVIDVGSGAGLPGLVLAVARPDLSLVLVDAKERRTTFLTEVVAALRLGDRVAVVRARAEECPGRIPLSDVVTTRALAPLDRLAAWCLPLAVRGGRVLAVKGAGAEEEIDAHAVAVRRCGGGPPRVIQCGAGRLAQPTTVIEIVREERTSPPPPDARPAARRRRPSRG